MSSSKIKRRSVLSKASVASAMVVALALSACSSDGSDKTDAGGAGKSDGTVNARIYSDPSSFDPAIAAGIHTYQLDRQLYDTVLRRDADGLVGGLASDWEATSATEYNFTIRDDATCSDGTPITASIVADSLKYLADPDTGSTWRALVFGQGDSTITADDDASSVKIVLSEPFTSLEMGLTVSQTGIICPAGLADLEGLKAGTVAGAFSGPYVLSASKPGISYSLSLRDDYKAWPDFSTPLKGTAPATIDYTLGNDESTTANQVLSGDIDFADFADYNTVARFKGDDSVNQHEVTGYTTYVVFNEREGRVFAGKPELRQAVARAIDQKAFNTVFSQGNSELLTSVVPASYDCVNTDASLLEKYDPAAAAKVLAGVSGIKLLGNTANISYTNGADYLYEALTGAGAKVDMTKVDNATFWSTIAKGDADWDVMFIGDQNAAQTISASLDRVIGPSVEENGRNFSGSDNPEGEKALQQGLSLTDPDARCAAFQTAQETLFDRDDVVPLVGGTTTTITSANVDVSIFGDYVDAATLRITD